MVKMQLSAKATGLDAATTSTAANETNNTSTLGPLMRRVPNSTVDIRNAFTEILNETSALPVPSHLSEDEPIQYQIVPNGRYETNLETWYSCQSGPSPDERAALPEKNPFSFTTNMQTNLNILFMGDSVGVEFGRWFQIAGQATHRDVLVQLKWKKNQPADGLAAARVSGGGVVSYWRLLGLFEGRHKGQALPNRGYGWRAEWKQQLRGHAKKQAGARRRYQILIFRVSHPWVCPEEVTPEKLQETVTMARSYIGKSIKVIFVTAPMNNNVYKDNATIPVDTRCATNCGLRDFEAMNTRIREFVATLNSPDVLVSDVGAYMSNIISWNAKQIGMATESLMQPLAPVDDNQKYFQQVAQVCAEKVPEGSTSCLRNVLSHDGMHLCMETVGPRMFANWACLIQCAYKEDMKLRQCEQDCNEKFFLLPTAAMSSDR